MEDQATPLAAVIGGLAIAKPIAESGTRLIESLLGEPCKVAGAMIADQLYAWQWRNRVTIAHHAREIMSHDGVAAQLILPGFLIPLIDTCGNIDDPELQALWAQLIASGTKDTQHQKVAFVHVLKDLSVGEALLLRFMREKAHEWEQALLHNKDYYGECTSVEAREYLGVSHSQVVFMAHSLIRLGLIAECSIDQLRRPADRNTVPMEYMLTIFGCRFADACMGFSSPPDQSEPLEHSQPWKHRV